MRPLFLYAFIPMSERRLFLILLLRPRRASLRDSFLTLNHRVHVVDKHGVCRIAVYHCQGVHRINQRAVGGFGGGYRGGLEENLTWARSHLGDLGLICIRQIFIWNGEMKTAA